MPKRKRNDIGVVQLHSTDPQYEHLDGALAYLTGARCPNPECPTDCRRAVLLNGEQVYVVPEEINSLPTTEPPHPEC